MPCNNNTNFLCQANHPLSQTPKPSPSPKRETITYGKWFRLFRGLLKEFTFCGSFYCLMPLSSNVGVGDFSFLYPMSEGLFNSVLGWIFMLAPSLFTDCKRDRC
ncbi:hypothetical protein NC652_021307 [Populus alba x Populus x berolinensis]|uniref:Uncharacterized protein n=1 Tax=Populus alba x Populus x berolinensis TaxID=444605 RepID=A0AAD6MMB6_9ROSI|nr:hypothetical protein NC652_021307 [Populus alba x Populus x berolinensis]KAJ6988006.1 hypothetical protein NC653_021058 [Populus alba x Populus x berolinensis]